MPARFRFSTRTVVNSEYLVPWLAAEGPLADSPAEPPARDYYFQYTWILPGLFDPQVNHYVIVRTALSNIRIITFFAGESEVKIVDPSRIPEVQPFGCEVQFVPPVQS